MPKTKSIKDKINLNGIEIEIEMVKVPAGSFMMGSEEWEYSQPVHKVTFDKPFFIAKYMVTQKLWKQVLGENNNPSLFKGDSRPVERVSWDMAKEFINKINKFSDKTYRLPSESEWEYASRGGQKFAKENLDYSGSNWLKEVGWYGKNSMKESKPIGLKMPNQLGLFDMSGNVWEWCQDNWKDNYKKHPLNGKPYSGEKANIRAVRGGCWTGSDFSCSVFVRIRSDRDNVGNYLGFRLARY